MSILFAEGFDGLARESSPNVPVTSAITAIALKARGLNFDYNPDATFFPEAGANAGNALRTYATSWGYAIGSNQPVVGIRAKVTSLTPAFEIFLRNSAGVEYKVKFININGGFTVTGPNNFAQTIPVSGSSNTPSPAAFNYLEFGIAGGKLTLRANGKDVAPGWTIPAFTTALVGYRTLDDFTWIDDIYIADDGIFRGDSVVRVLQNPSLLVNNGTVVNGNTALDVLKDFNGGRSYVQLSNSGDKVGTKIDSIPAEVTNIHAVTVVSSRAKSSSSFVQSKLSLNIGGTDYEVNTQSPSTDFFGQRGTRDKNPATQESWTRSNLVNVGTVMEMI